MPRFSPPITFEDTIKVILDSNDKMTIWILSRLSFAVEQCNSGLSTYNFPTATTGIYQFFLYEFCDKYLEHVKPLLRVDTSNITEEMEKTLTGCRAALHLCLDTSLKLLAPFMPFISEELWQRLPKAQNGESQPSIHVTEYPKNDKFQKLRNLDIEEAEENVFSIVRQIRGTRANYDVQKQIKLDVYLSEVSSDKIDSIKFFSNFITTVCGCKLTVADGNGQDVPKGCAVCVLPFAKVNIVLADIIDKEKELNKLASKRETKSTSLKKLVEQTKMDDYETKVPEAVRMKNTEKIQELEKEIADMETATETLKAMQL